MKYIDIIENKAQILYGFLEVNRNEDEGDVWSCSLDPAIVKFLNKLNKNECELIKQQMWNWGDINLTNLADPILEVENSHLDSNFLYGKIFLTIQNTESLEYLIENIYVINDSIKTRPFKFYSDLIEKIEWVAKQLQKDYSIYQKHIVDKLQKEFPNHKIRTKKQTTINLPSLKIDINSGIIYCKNEQLNLHNAKTKKFENQEIKFEIETNLNYLIVTLDPNDSNIRLNISGDDFETTSKKLENEINKLIEILTESKKRTFNWGKIKILTDPRMQITFAEITYKNGIQQGINENSENRA